MLLSLVFQLLNAASAASLVQEYGEDTVLRALIAVGTLVSFIRTHTPSEPATVTDAMPVCLDLGCGQRAEGVDQDAAGHLRGRQW